MTDSPDEIRADIERTRQNLGGDVDALADKVAPSKIAHRQADKVRGALGTIRDRVMGVAEDAGSAASDAVHEASDAVHNVSDTAREAKAKAEGNPLAVGLIAFGAGLLAASLLPASSGEKSVAARAKERAQPLVDEAQSIAKDVAGDLKEPAQHAVDAVTERAKDAAESVKQEATAGTEAVKDRAHDAREHIGDN